MTGEGCRKWREQIGSLVLGHLDPDERIALEAHLDGCRRCRAEAGSLRALSAVMPLADPTRDAPPPPPPELGERIAGRIAAERKQSRRSRSIRIGIAVGTAFATLLLVFAGVRALSTGDEGGADAGWLAFNGGSGRVEIAGTLEPGPLGTQIRMQVTGVRSGTLCRVFLARRDGSRSFAGTFRYRYQDGPPEAVLSSALDLSNVASVGVRAAGHTFVVPIGRDGVAATLEYERIT